MKKLIGVLIFGTILGLASAFCAGSMEAMRLAEGVNFDNQSEVLAYATALRRNEAVIAQAKGEGIHIDIWIKNVAEGMTENYHSNQKAEAEKQVKVKRFADAEAWSSQNISAGALLLDANTQTTILSDYEQNEARGEISAKFYVGKVIQYTGEVYSVSVYSDKVRIFLTGVTGGGRRIYLFADIADSEVSAALALNKDEIVTVVGECSLFGRRDFSTSDTPDIDLINTSIKRVWK